MAAANPHPDWEPLSWDTACFGFPTARLRAGWSPGSLENALAELRSAGFRLAYGNVDPKDGTGFAEALASGGTRVDERLLYELEPIRSDPPGVAGRSVVDAVGRGWDAALEDMAVLAGAYSRFRVDTNFPPDRFQALYREWMRKSLSGERADAVLALPGKEGAPGRKGLPGGEGPLHGDGRDGEDGPQAFVTLTARDGRGSIGLIAVAPGRQRLGLGSELMRASSAWFRAKNCRCAGVVTQAANGAACALYERHGYRIARREIVFHFWL